MGVTASWQGCQVEYSRGERSAYSGQITVVDGETLSNMQTLT